MWLDGRVSHVFQLLKIFKHPSTPSAEEIELWAFDGGADEPIQDWDLVILSHAPHEPLYMRLASTKDCPKREYFLALLYLLVGEAVRGNYREKSQAHIEGLLRLAEHKFPSFWLHLWVQRSRRLLNNPKSFDFEEWCGGGLAGKYENN